MKRGVARAAQDLFERGVARVAAEIEPPAGFIRALAVGGKAELERLRLGAVIVHVDEVRLDGRAFGQRVCGSLGEGRFHLGDPRIDCRLRRPRGRRLRRGGLREGNRHERVVDAHRGRALRQHRPMPGAEIALLHCRVDDGESLLLHRAMLRRMDVEPRVIAARARHALKRQRMHRAGVIQHAAEVALQVIHVLEHHLHVIGLLRVGLLAGDLSHRPLHRGEELHVLVLDRAGQ
jgi:hypothetical protein